MQQDLTLSVGTVQETITITGGNPGPPPTAEELQARESRKLEDQQKVEEFRRKRAAAVRAGPPPSANPRIGGNIRTPAKLRDVKPRFPERMNGTDGDVVLSAVIGTDGNVDSVDVVSATSPEFADSAMEAVKQWQFDATLLNGQRSKPR